MNRKYRGSSDSGYTILAAAVVFIIVLLCSFGGSIVKNNTKDVVTVTVLDADIAKTEDNGNRYLIRGEFADGTQETFNIADNLLAGMTNSSDLYFELKALKGQKVELTVVGWRWSWQSWYREIIKYKKVTE